MATTPQNKTLVGRVLADRAAAILSEKKADGLLLIEASGYSTLTDFVLLATGNSPPHLKALLTELQHTLKQEGVYPFRRSGTPESGWMVLDYVDLIVHIFSPEARTYYALEELWPEAPREAL